MREITVNQRAPNTPDYEIPQDFRLDDYLRRDPWELGTDEAAPTRARVRFPSPLSLWAERNRYGTLAEEFDDGATIREFEFRQPEPLLRWPLTLEGRAEIVAPAELADAFRQLAQDVVDLYRETPAPPAVQVPAAQVPAAAQALA
jgi:hypothetical protein